MHSLPGQSPSSSLKACRSLQKSVPCQGKNNLKKSDRQLRGKGACSCHHRQRPAARGRRRRCIFWECVATLPALDIEIQECKPARVRSQCRSVICVSRAAGPRPNKKENDHGELI